MSTMKLRQQVLQDVISLMDKDWAMEELQLFLSDLKKQDREGRIPGLPYTEEERKRAIRCAENDWRMGRTHTHDEVVATMEKAISSWKSFYRPACCGI